MSAGDEHRAARRERDNASSVAETRVNRLRFRRNEIVSAPIELAGHEHPASTTEYVNRAARFVVGVRGKAVYPVRADLQRYGRDRTSTISRFN